MLRATTPCTFRKSISSPPKVVRTWCGLYILISKYASRYSGVLFFETRPLKVVRPPPGVLYILTSKCALCHNGVYFFETRPLSLQKWSEPPSISNILICKCASRHNGVYFSDILSAKSGPYLVCFLYFDLVCASRYNGMYFFDIVTSKSG